MRELRSGLLVPSVEALSLVVHELGFAPSAQALSAMLRSRGLPHEVAQVLDQLPEVALFRFTEAEQEGGPRVPVSLRRFPHVSRRDVLEMLAPLRLLGTKGDRAAVKELVIASELRAMLAHSGYRVERRGRAWDGECEDVTIVRGREMLDLEVRNRRSEVHEFKVKAKDREMIERDVGRGIVPVFVFPECSGSWRDEAEGLGAVVIEDHAYVVGTSEQRRIWQSFGVEAWETLTASEAGPRLAAQIIGELGLEVAEERAEPRPEARTAGHEVRKAMVRRDHQQLVSEALSLHAEGVKPVEAALEQLGCSRSTLQRAFTGQGMKVADFWSHGGKRR